MSIRELKRRILVQRRTYGAALVAVVVSGSVGMVLLQQSSAATFVANAEAENGTIAGNAAKLTGTDATGASAASSVRFVAGSTPPGGGFQSNCIVKPSACGYPDETNTGVPPGTSLTNVASINVTESYIASNGGRGSDGRFVLSNKNVSEQIMVRANNVTIKNTRITTGTYYPIDFDGGYSGLLVEDSEIIGTGPAVTAGISFSNYTARRVSVMGSSDGLKANDNVIIEDSYITKLCQSPGAHNDCVQFYGSGGVTLRHNTIKASVATAAGVNGCTKAEDIVAIQINTGAANSVIENNLIDSYNAYWSINGSGASSLLIRNNRFTKSYTKYPGTPISLSGNPQSSGNYFDDSGAAAN